MTLVATPAYAQRSTATISMSPGSACSGYNAIRHSDVILTIW
ncbi:hypothetical protein HMPREF0591_0330 [Mycobacterium parascrofulaceum ATCC BAA-614]|uniref:Uncharacterized protein n=1 Tax=Mycobacterium parascrofulaceum ATCC BAA-614 TaxID=525368 RepID=D5P2D6_9MYCO|nr:hypothetical protein HMPREF0591_0330 [Mycobacterium parascrofulaceum ATCC BAA-614]